MTTTRLHPGRCSILDDKAEQCDHCDRWTKSLYYRSKCESLGYPQPIPARSPTPEPRSGPTRKVRAGKPMEPPKCIHLGAKTGKTVDCPSCKNRTVKADIYQCAVYGECTVDRSVGDVACCNGKVNKERRHVLCPGKVLPGQEPSPPPEPTKESAPSVKTWSYGVTTIPDRRKVLLPRTLASLRNAGFDAPRLFVDGDDDAQSWRDEFGLEVTVRNPRLRTHGNWVLSIYELFIREPKADLYALFQDDFLTYRNLRAYLERCEYPRDGYLNLYTFPENQHRCPIADNGQQKIGWYHSNQCGKGAIALVFSSQAVRKLLSHPHLVERPMDDKRGWRAVDGGVVDTMRKQGFKEYVHNPSLVQHTGQISSMENKSHPKAKSFRGEEFDALDLLTEELRI